MNLMFCRPPGWSYLGKVKNGRVYFVRRQLDDGVVQFNWLTPSERGTFRNMVEDLHSIIHVENQHFVELFKEGVPKSRSMVGCVSTSDIINYFVLGKMHNTPKNRLKSGRYKTASRKALRTFFDGNNKNPKSIYLYDKRKLAGKCDKRWSFEMSRIFEISIIWREEKLVLDASQNMWIFAALRSYMPWNPEPSYCNLKNCFNWNKTLCRRAHLNILSPLTCLNQFVQVFGNPRNHSNHRTIHTQGAVCTPQAGRLFSNSSSSTAKPTYLSTKHAHR